MYALSSVLAALFARERTGRGTAISVGLFDAVAEWMGYALNQARYGGVDVEPNGMSSPAVAPYGAYPTARRADAGARHDQRPGVAAAGVGRAAAA